MAGWSDQGFVLASRPHGEGGLIVSALTRQHGRHLGLVQGGRSARKRGWFEPGATLALSWSARLESQLGRYTLAEPLTTGIAALLLEDADRLAALASASALLEVLLPERQANPEAFAGFADFLGRLSGPDWRHGYVAWERGLAAALGYGLDLESCAATGSNDHLAYVSPRSGRAVSAAAGEPYRDRLLPLPAFLIDPAEAVTPADWVAALRVTGHFLGLVADPRPLPPARERLIARWYDRTMTP